MTSTIGSTDRPLNEGNNSIIKDLESMAKSRFIYINKLGNLQSAHSRLDFICIKIAQFVSYILNRLSFKVDAPKTDINAVQIKLYEFLFNKYAQGKNFSEDNFELLCHVANKTGLIAKETLFPQKTLEAFFKECRNTLGIEYPDVRIIEGVFVVPHARPVLGTVVPHARPVFNDRTRELEIVEAGRNVVRYPIEIMAHFADIVCELPRNITQDQYLKALNLMRLFQRCVSQNQMGVSRDPNQMRVALNLSQLDLGDPSPEPMNLANLSMVPHVRQLSELDNDFEVISPMEIQNALAVARNHEVIANQIIPMMAHFADLAYELPRGMKVGEYNGHEYNISYLKRETGAGIEEKPVLCLEAGSGVIFSVPGTETENDWVSNAYTDLTPIRNCPNFNQGADQQIFVTHGQYEAHSGFLTVANSIIESLSREIKCRNNSLFSDKKTIYFTGHSQGAAVASLLALYFATHREFLRIPLDCKIICTTFASPRVFNKETVEFYNAQVKETYRIANPADVVPRFPLGASGFGHVGIKMSMRFNHFGRLVIGDGIESMNQSIRLDLSAIARIISWSFSIFNSLGSWAALPHSMKLYARMVTAPEGKELSLELIRRGRVETRPQLAIEAPPSHVGSRMRYTPASHSGRDGDEDGSVTTENLNQVVGI